MNILVFFLFIWRSFSFIFFCARFLWTATGLECGLASCKELVRDTFFSFLFFSFFFLISTFEEWRAAGTGVETTKVGDLYKTLADACVRAGSE